MIRCKMIYISKVFGANSGAPLSPTKKSTTVLPHYTGGHSLYQTSSTNPYNQNSIGLQVPRKVQKGIPPIMGTNAPSHSIPRKLSNEPRISDTTRPVNLPPLQVNHRKRPDILGSAKRNRNFFGIL
jgi:hypothetical protein